MSGSDSPLRGSAAVPPKKRRQSGKRTPARACSQAASAAGPSLADGPLVFVAVIGDPCGRWSPSQCNAGAALQAVWANAGVALATLPPLEHPMLLGFAVLQAWHFVMELVGPASKAMFAACQRTDGARRAGVGALRHTFLAACALSDPIPLPGGAGSSETLGAKARHLAAGKACTVSNNLGVCAVYDSLDGVLGRWTTSGLVAPENLRSCFAWPLWTPLAASVVRGQWTVDMTTVLIRATRTLWRAPVQPPELSMRQYKRWLGLIGSIPVAPDEPVSRARHPSERFHTAQNLVVTLRLAQFLSAQRLLAPAVAAARDLECLRAVSTDAAAAVSGGCSGGGGGGALPHWTTVARARARLDVCAMAVQRQSGARGFFRYLFFDASPQGSGREVFCCAERLIDPATLDAAASGSPVCDRRLPICGLGQGRTSLEDKVACLVHQLWLDYGPAAADVRAACRSVRSCLSDMGVEFGICDFPGVVDALLLDRLIGVHEPARVGRTSAAGSSSTGSGTAATASGFLFPLALKIPGTRHIVDWVLQRAVQRCPWWTEWQSQCKEVMHCLHSARQRERLQHWLGQQCLSNKESLVASLGKAPPNFAAWRWHTLSDVVTSFLRMEAALRTAAASADSATLFESRQGAAASICATLVSHTFSDRARGLQELMRPLVMFTQWLGRCPCHEDSDPASASCPWKGCIGPQLAARVSATVTELQGLRERRLGSAVGSGGSGQSSGGTCDLDIAVSAELAVSDLLAKFHWASEPPYLVWQARAGEL